MLSLALVAVLGACALAPVTAFLPTTLNYTDPDLQDTFCPESMTGPTYDHKAITRESLRREVRRYFLENPPTNETFTIPEDASLSQIYRAYYGPNSSPARFLKAVNNIAWSNAMTEVSGQQRFQPESHMDGETILKGHVLLQDRYKLLIPTITEDVNYDFARELLGTSLNGIQDFYSQSTWVEVGDGSVVEGLGLPGGLVGDVAGPDDAVCTDCDDTNGACKDNVLPGSLLSSGYYEYSTPGADDFVVPKPEGKGKCSHGGTMDSSVGKDAIGGINKETSSPCFSPHHDLHEAAASLATSASEHYIATVRDAIGDKHFLGLLDLFGGSALSIVIDITYSMNQELEAVKEEARLIVETTNPELYVLVPFGDPEVGPVTKTTDKVEFLKILDDLSLNGGCCCLEELFWHGLQLALVNTPDYSSIFCFTDAGAHDAELMDGVLALATTKHARVSVIYSYDNGKLQSEEEMRKAGGDSEQSENKWNQNEVEGDSQDRSCPGYVVSGTDEYKHLASLTGGQFIEIDKFDIDDVTGIMESGVEQSQVTIRSREDVTELQDFSFPIDESVIDFQILMSGPVWMGTLTDQSGSYYDLMDPDALNATGVVNIVTYTDSIKFITFKSPTLGDWAIQVNADESFSVLVTATATLSLLTELTQVELEPPRPGYVLIRGSPLAGVSYYVEISLVGYLDVEVQELTAMEFVDTKGSLLSHVEYRGELDDHMYVLSDPLPPSSFYIQVVGFLNSGNLFSRMVPTMSLPVECLVDLVESKSLLVAEPGQSTKAYFTVYNHGPEAEFEFIASDEEEYIYTWYPQKSTIPSLGSVEVEVDFTVPDDALYGSTSTVFFTATSLDEAANTNTYITYYLVIDSTVDDEPPTCRSSDVVNCTDHDSEDDCATGSWSVTATLHDPLSGLDRVYSRPDEGLTVEEFPDASTDPVAASYSASCCIRSLDIIAVDKKGNVGKCKWELGELKGWVTEFVAESVGETWVLLRWNISAVRADFYNWNILINNDFTEVSRCPDLVCYMNVTYLDSCTLHSFDLTPHFRDDDGVETEGAMKAVEASTLDVVPYPPTNPELSYTTETSTSISWDPPSNVACLSHYKVCYTIVAGVDATCLDSYTNTITLEDLEACTLYHVTITSLSTSGLTSDQLKFDTNTDDAAPGVPENLRITNQTANWVALAWDDPLERASCVDKWMISYAETNARFRGNRQPILTADNFATLAPLLACTNYTFWVSGVSPKGLQGSTRDTSTTMEEAEPTAVNSVEAVAEDPTTVLAVWVPAEDEQCVDHYHVCITDIDDLSIKECRDTSDHEDTFTGLAACGDYDVSVKAVAPSGNLGQGTYDVVTTHDLPASEPTDLKVLEATPHTATISYGPPLVNPRCVMEYHFVIKEVQYNAKLKTSISTHLEEMFSGLDSCTGYELRVSSLTASGYQSVWVSVNFTTEEEATSEPRAFTDMEVSATSVTLQWFIPQTNPLCAASYLLEWTTGSTEITITGYQPEVVYEVEGLTACTLYTFTVTPMTPLGAAGPSATHDATTTCA